MMKSTKAIGEILVERGVLSPTQVQQVLDRQAKESRPFGKLAAEMFGLTDRVLWEAWGAQMAPYLDRVDLASEPSEARALAMVDPRDAWDRRVLPISISEQAVRLATDLDHLPEVVAWTYQRLSPPPEIVLTDSDQVDQQIILRYTAAGYAPGWNDQDPRLLA